MSKALWQPSADRIARARLTAFTDQVERQQGMVLPDYCALHRWSITEPEAFWSAVWDFCGVLHSRAPDLILEQPQQITEARWFPGCRLNYAENLLRFRDDQTALVSLLEDGSRRAISYGELYQQVSRVAGALRDMEIGPGDRVAAIMPNIPESVIAMLATTAVGALWSSCSPDFGSQGILDRLGQIEPRLLFVSDGYRYNGKAIDIRARITEVVAHIPSIEQVVVTLLLQPEAEPQDIPHSIAFESFCAEQAVSELVFEQLPFDHPLFIMYSSGTTGPPKCIVHGAGGTLLQHLKEHQLHTNIGRNDVLFYFTTCGWMMWNWLISGLASGCTLILYDGSAMAGDGQRLLDAIDDEGITVFGASAGFIGQLRKSGRQPNISHRLNSMHTLLSTGSPLSEECFRWVYEHVKKDLQLSSIAGGTDIISCFVLGNPTLPVYAGEIQCLGLGMAVEIWNAQGKPVLGEKGELVCTRAFPSCPLGFWNDSDGSRFQRAYFSQFPETWMHGDFGAITPHGGMIIYGRSDAVLNPGGVRIGTAEIYREVEQVEDILDSVVIGQEWAGDTRIVLFVRLRAERVLDDQLETLIRQRIRSSASPRHVPARILQVSAIPHTLSGKVVELAVKEVVHGRPVRNLDALANPESLDQFRNRAELQH